MAHLEVRCTELTQEREWCRKRACKMEMPYQRNTYTHLNKWKSSQKQVISFCSFHMALTIIFLLSGTP